ncbi:MAG: lipoyl(octanoyl) transferase LipB [Aggregatilineales bacterium]
MALCRVAALGRMPYQDAWALQKRLAEARGRDAIPDTFLLLEHPHVYTLGSAAKPEHIRWSAAECGARGVEIHQIDRGGDVTYHGPGQLVGYPILKLPRGENGLRTDVIGYVRALETTLIQALAAFDVTAFPYPGLTGVWVGTPPLLDPDGRVQADRGAAKIAAIGVKVTTKAVTQHGFALNVAPDMAYFGGIVPCGIPDKPVTSLAQMLGTAPSMETVMDQVTVAFGDVFGCDLSLESSI